MMDVGSDRPAPSARAMRILRVRALGQRIRRLGVRAKILDIHRANPHFGSRFKSSCGPA
jgi:hypothetical protein